MLKTLKQSFATIIISLTLLAGVNLVFSWNAPSDVGYSISGNVPTGNVATPINVGATSQYKSGAVGVGGLFRTYSLHQASGGIRLDGVLGCTALGTNGNGDILCVGTTACVPSCTGKQCGNDGCSGSCGTCASPATCDGSGQCVSPSYTYSCVSYSCGACSEECGGTQTCTGTCQRNDGVIVGSSYCSGGCSYSEGCGSPCVWQNVGLTPICYTNAPGRICTQGDGIPTYTSCSTFNSSCYIWGIGCSETAAYYYDIRCKH